MEVDPLGVLEVDPEGVVEVDPLGLVEVDPEGVVVDPAVVPEVVPVGLAVLVPLVVPEVDPVALLPLVAPADVVPVGVLPDVVAVEPLVDSDGVLPLPTFPAVDTDVVEPEVPVVFPLVEGVLVPAEAVVFGPVGDTGTLELTLAALPEAAPLFPDPPITPKPNSKAKASNAKAIKPPMIHQQGWQSAASLGGSLSGPNFLVGWTIWLVPVYLGLSISSLTLG